MLLGDWTGHTDELCERLGQSSCWRWSRRRGCYGTTDIWRRWRNYCCRARHRFGARCCGWSCRRSARDQERQCPWWERAACGRTPAESFLVGQARILPLGLTIHSSRSRFAARLNSGVRRCSAMDASHIFDRLNAWSHLDASRLQLHFGADAVAIVVSCSKLLLPMPLVADDVTRERFTELVALLRSALVVARGRWATRSSSQANRSTGAIEKVPAQLCGHFWGTATRPSTGKSPSVG